MRLNVETDQSGLHRHAHVVLLFRLWDLHFNLIVCHSCQFQQRVLWTPVYLDMSWDGVMSCLLKHTVQAEASIKRQDVEHVHKSPNSSFYLQNILALWKSVHVILARFSPQAHRQADSLARLLFGLATRYWYSHSYAPCNVIGCIATHKPQVRLPPG